MDVDPNQSEVDRIAEKAKLLNDDDPLRRGILERCAKWYAERCATKREKILRDIEKRAQRLAY